MKATAAIALIAAGGAGLIYGCFLFLVRLDVVSSEALRFASVAILLWVSIVILAVGVLFLIRKQGASSNGPT